MKSFVVSLAAGVALLSIRAEAGQKPEIPEVSIKATTPKADAWSELLQSSQAALGGSVADDGTVGTAPNGAGRIDALLAAAARLEDFSTANSLRPEVIEAKRLELLALFQAAFLGDDSRKARRDELADELGKEGTLSQRYRCEFAAWTRNLEVARRAFGSRRARLEAYERVARQLIAEFPGEPDPYEALLGIARSTSAARGVEVAREILAMNAPESAKERARALVGPRP